MFIESLSRYKRNTQTHSTRSAFFVALIANLAIYFIYHFLCIRSIGDVFYPVLLFCISLFFGIWEWSKTLSLRDDSYVSKELNILGWVTIEKNLKIGFYLFLISEVLIFASFFWALFYFLFSPKILTGVVWPSKDFPEMNITNIPLLNTLITFIYL